MNLNMLLSNIFTLFLLPLGFDALHKHMMFTAANLLVTHWECVPLMLSHLSYRVYRGVRLALLTVIVLEMKVLWTVFLHSLPACDRACHISSELNCLFCHLSPTNQTQVIELFFKFWVPIHINLSNSVLRKGYINCAFSCLNFWHLRDVLC